MPKKPITKLPYDVSWILQRFRAILLGREYRSNLRWAKDLAPKTQPQPELPLGPSSKIRFNYYCNRDPRGEVERPQVLYNAEIYRQQTLGRSASCSPLEAGEEIGGTKSEEEKETKKGEEKAEKDNSKMVGGKEEQVKDKMEGDRKDIGAIKVAVQKEGQTDEKETKKTAGEGDNKMRKKEQKEVRVMSEKEDTSKTPGEQKEKDQSEKATLGEDKETGKKEDKQWLEMSWKDREAEEETGAVKRVPGKVWHWDTVDGEPDKRCCRKKQDG